MSQEAMADLLSISLSSYQRLEKGETTVSFKDLPRIESVLDLGVQDLIPDTLSIYSNNNESGLIFGNVTINNFTDKDDYCQNLDMRIKELEELLAKSDNKKSIFK